MSNVIWWIRRDLRLTDNAALNAALSCADKIIPAFILDPVLLKSKFVGKTRLAFLFNGLRKLDADLRNRNSKLVVRQGDPLVNLLALTIESNAERIIAVKDYTPYAYIRDARIAAILGLQLVDGVTVAQPGRILKDNGEPYTVFTPFSRKWKKEILPEINDVTQAPSFVPSISSLFSMPIPEAPLTLSGEFPSGEKHAQDRLHAFTSEANNSIFNYAEIRNRVDQNGTSKLSPYLRFGMISAKQAINQAIKAIASAPDELSLEGANVWLTELIWREFYAHILHHFPKVLGSSFRPVYNHIEWDNDAAKFAAWCEGRTGYPIVDAAMRQLVKTGWVHNRNRMIVASFLVKDLFVDWKWGERFFMQHLIDGDPAANNGGWQWIAGTGTDAAPYFRIFNPILQGKKCDPQGVFVRRWIPELSSIPNRYIHSPWEMSVETQRKANCMIGQDYPQPIIDHNVARKQTLAAYSQVRKSIKG